MESEFDVNTRVLVVKRALVSAGVPENSIQGEKRDRLQKNNACLLQSYRPAAFD